MRGNVAGLGHRRLLGLAPAEHETCGGGQVNEAAGDPISLPPEISAARDTGGPNVRIVITERMTTRSTPPAHCAARCWRWRSLGGRLRLLRAAATTAASTPTTPSALAGSPPPLAALHTQANELLPRRHRRLRKADRGAAAATRSSSTSGPPGAAPAASSSRPCRSSPPATASGSPSSASTREDSDDAAATFLAEAPVPYPSYTDPDKELADSLGGLGGLPDTAFYDRAGKLVYLKQGPYADDAELEADVRRYALEGG